ncbi:MAG: hypothetical protein E7812_14565 [Phenylobacterium sp.]|nr:MAG: hypothetical protein E7812_14565 [Phenylobacterium sp.]
MATMTPGEALLQSMAGISARAKVAFDLQAELDAAARFLASADAVGPIITMLGEGPSAWYSPPPASLEFPRDHAPHPGQPPEWYWIACNLTVEGGAPDERMGVLLSMQRNQVIDPAIQAQAGWSVEEAQLLFSYATVVHTTASGPKSYFRSPNLVWPPFGGTTTMQADPFLFQCGPDSFSGSVDVLPLQVSIQDNPPDGDPLIVELTLSSKMAAQSAFFLQGKDGFTPPPRAGLYYSWPQLQVSGQVSVGGQTYQVSGTAWMDHEMMYQPLPPPSGPVPTPPETWTPPQGIGGWTFCIFNLENGDSLVVAGFQEGPMLPTLPAPYGFYLRPVDGIWQKTFLEGVISMPAFMPLMGDAMLPVAWSGAFTARGGGERPTFTFETTPWTGDASFLAVNQSIQGEAPAGISLRLAEPPPGGFGGPVTLTGTGYCETVGYEPVGSFMRRARAYLSSTIGPGAAKAV